MEPILRAFSVHRESNTAWEEEVQAAEVWSFESRKLVSHGPEIDNRTRLSDPGQSVRRSHLKFPRYHHVSARSGCADFGRLLRSRIRLRYSAFSFRPCSLNSRTIKKAKSNRPTQAKLPEPAWRMSACQDCAESLAKGWITMRQCVICASHRGCSVRSTCTPPPSVAMP